MKFSLFIIIICATICAAQTNTVLRDELVKMREVDRNAREECAKGNGDEQIKCLVETMEKIDKPNTKRLEEIFAQKGFPTGKPSARKASKLFCCCFNTRLTKRSVSKYRRNKLQGLE